MAMALAELAKEVQIKKGNKKTKENVGISLYSTEKMYNKKNILD